jgi:hypothetical protein
MRLSKWGAFLAGVTIVVLGTAFTAQQEVDTLAGVNEAVTPAQPEVVTFSAITDAAAAKFFDATTSAPDTLEGNRLIIGFNTGTDPATWKFRDFRASSAAFSHTLAMDTISFKVEAPAGFYISRITYSQQGTGSIVRTGRVSGGATWVVGDVATDIGQFVLNPTLSSTADLTGLNMTVVPVSITASLFAFATPTSGSASLSLTGAEVLVEILPLTQ